MYRLYSLLFLAVLAITACSTAPQRPQPPAEDPLAQAAQANVERGDYLAAAQLYLSESKTAPEKQRIPLRLSAAEYLAQGQCKICYNVIILLRVLILIAILLLD